ncbi:MAG: hypothetical protein JRI95_10300 [Deltaproteobacteria bacterium]|nr:hypothetical protein [Deltaproteobacteria bacterium]MBW2086888.1 hypothetical protein [Deltaproteobacteria bacterium]
MPGKVAHDPVARPSTQYLNPVVHDLHGLLGQHEGNGLTAGNRLPKSKAGSI